MTSTDALDLWQLPDQELATMLVAHEQVLARAHARGLELLGEALRRGLATTLGYRDELRLLTQELRLSNREAKARLRQAAATQPGNGMAGGERAAALPATAEALHEGAINAEHVRVICDLFADCPDWVTGTQRTHSERQLVALAGQAQPETLRKAAGRIATHWDQDGKPPSERERELAHPDREFHCQPTRDGGMRFSGQLDPETAATLDGLFGPLAKPRPADEDGRPDPRTVAQRRGDALGEIIALAARADDLAMQGGERAVVTVTLSLPELEGRVRDALLAVPGGVSLERLRRWACDARLVPANFGARGEPLYLGRSSRTASQAQRRALALRDGGCARPGCTRPPKWCEAHHVDQWGNTGPTNIDSLVLLCEVHHREIHHTEWMVRMVDGIPEFIPPAYIDPNTAYLVDPKSVPDGDSGAVCR